ncbi:MAG: hypothetical protein ABIP47_05460 [Saprospiraceae bacterium]
MSGEANLNIKPFKSFLSNPQLDTVFNNHGMMTSNLCSRYKNKILFVEIWFAGCNGTKYEVPFFNSLQEKYQSKNIAFITICLNSDKVESEFKINKNQMFGDHYLLNLGQSNQFIDGYDIQSYPYFMIFGIHKNLLYGDAPRPSSPILDSILNNLSANFN